ncbi:MAG: hypothetical protein UIM53_02770 [Acutalibacteraceae bacterium]|nr:hypothetical protein [Acutalibacteraceae bacterium]
MITNKKVEGYQNTITHNGKNYTAYTVIKEFPMFHIKGIRTYLQSDRSEDLVYCALNDCISVKNNNNYLFNGCLTNEQLDYIKKNFQQILDNMNNSKLEDNELWDPVKYIM